MKSRPFFWVEENPRALHSLREAAAALPQDEIILYPIRRRVWNVWSTPLAFAFGHRIVPVNTASPPGAAGLKRWWSYQHGRGQPVWILFHDKKWPESWPAAQKVTGFEFERQGFESTKRPLPSKIVRSSRRLLLYRSDPPTDEAPPEPALP